MGPVCAPYSHLGGLVRVRPPVLDDVRRCEAGHTSPIMATPFIKLVGVAILIAKKVASG